MPARVEALRRPQILTACLFLTHALGVTRAWSLSRPPPCARAATNTPNAPTELRRVAALAACAAEHAHAGGGEAVPDERSEREAVELLDVLEVWLRRQKVSSVLSREQATALLEDLRNDKRFWAQQRRQFSRVWTAIVEGLSQEERPLSAVLGPDTSSRLLDALEEMDDEAMEPLVSSIVRSELVEKLLGHVLYEGILEFVESVDLLGNLINKLPILGPLRQQAVAEGRKQLRNVMGDQLVSFLGEYTASAASQAASFALSKDNARLMRSTRRKVATRLLETPIGKLFALNDFEMAILRDSIWTAVQEFRLPNEEQLLDRLYGEFGDEPFSILLPRAERRADGAPFFESGRDVLRGTLSQFLASDDWGEWMDEQRQEPGRPRKAPASPPPLAEEPVAAPAPPPAVATSEAQHESNREPAPWDGWD